MPLVNGRECGDAVSTKDDIRPHCGAPVERVTLRVVQGRSSTRSNGPRMYKAFQSSISLGILYASVSRVTAFSPQSLSLQLDSKISALDAFNEFSLTRRRKSHHHGIP